jgi:hypothetical protein
LYKQPRVDGEVEQPAAEAAGVAAPTPKPVMSTAIVETVPAATLPRTKCLTFMSSIPPVGTSCFAAYRSHAREEAATR